MDPVELDDDLNDETATYCGRLGCGKVLVHKGGRGRRAEYCSDACRRSADRSYKRARSHTELLETQLKRKRYEVAAYGRQPDDGVMTPEEFAERRGDAFAALARAEAFIEIGQMPTDGMSELMALVDAFRPVLEAVPSAVSARSAS